jgi:phospholipase/lecithinase/hemolysin
VVFLEREKIMRSLRAAVVVSGVVLASSWATAAQFSSILSFGDSLSDAGNVSSNTFGLIPGPAYFNGRFSNGPIWLDVVAQSQGLAAPRPALAPFPQPGASNFAIGGSRVNTNAVFFGQPVPSFTSTVAGYVATGPAVGSDTLVTIWIGSNDYLSGGLPAPTGLVNSVRDSVLGLAQFKGARQFLILGLAPIGLTPDVRAQGAVVSQTVNLAVQAYNAELQQMTQALPTLFPGVKATYFDTYGLFESILANPAAAGLTNVTSPALTPPTVVPNPDEYLWWDGVHPTRVAHAALGNAVAQAIPEPASLSLMAAALPLLTRRRATSAPR